MKGWSLDANIQTEVLTWWVWRSLRTDIGTKLPRGSAVSNPHRNWLLGMTSLLSLSFELWTKLCLQTSRKYHSLLFLSAQVSFFNLAKIPICLENLLHIFRTAPYLCVSPLWPLWSSPWLPLWLSVSLEFWELIISWSKSTRFWKQKEKSILEITCEDRNKSGVYI